MRFHQDCRSGSSFQMIGSSVGADGAVSVIVEGIVDLLGNSDSVGGVVADSGVRFLQVWHCCREEHDPEGDTCCAGEDSDGAVSVA